MAAVVIRHPRSLIREHRELRHTLNRLDAMLSHPPGGEGRPIWLRDLSHRLSELRPGLQEHFAEEKESGLFEEIESAAPGLAETSSRLMQEHDTIIRTLDDLVDAIAVLPPFDIPFQSLLSRMKRFSRDLADHESRENEVLLQALDGGPDAID